MARLLMALVVLAAGVSSANAAFFKAEVVDATAATKLPRTPADPAWAGLTGKHFRLTPQRTVRLHDKKANEVLAAGPGATEVLVKVAAGTSELAVFLEWPDAVQELVRADEVNVFADSIAVETPERFGAGLRLPAVSMGDDEAHVAVTLLRATKGGALVSRFSAAGFGSSTRQAPATETPAVMQYDEAKKVWRAVVTLPLESPNPGLVPLAFAAWDGGRGERAGYKRLSAWHFARLPGKAPDPAYVKEMGFGYEPGDLGDPAAGKALAETICIACHRFPGREIAPAGMAPNLELIGAIATPGYLRDSVVTPSEVVIHEPNPNQHYSPSAARDPNGAFPNADAFRWSQKGPDGRWLSKMPTFAQFTPTQIADLVAFLKTLAGPPLEKP